MAAASGYRSKSPDYGLELSTACVVSPGAKTDCPDNMTRAFGLSDRSWNSSRIWDLILFRVQYMFQSRGRSPLRVTHQAFSLRHRVACRQEPFPEISDRAQSRVVILLIANWFVLGWLMSIGHLHAPRMPCFFFCVHPTHCSLATPAR